MRLKSSVSRGFQKALGLLTVAGLLFSPLAPISTAFAQGANLPAPDPAQAAPPDDQLRLAAALGGPVIIGGDDLTDHGNRNTSTGALLNGWLYIEKSLANLKPRVTRVHDNTIAVLGSTDSTANSLNAGAAYHWAAPKVGLTPQFFDGAGNINSFFVALNNGTRKPAILVMPGTDSGNDLDLSEGNALSANAVAIANFVNSGGGLMAHGVGSVAFGWLKTLLPGINFPNGCNTPLVLTPAGQSAFPGLTNANISSGPCHGHFTGDFGGLTVLATESAGTKRSIILGGAAAQLPGSLTLAPATAVNILGQSGSHTVTATAKNPNNTVAVGATVTFNVSAGPNSPRTGTAVTNASGVASFTYTTNGLAGIDQIVATFTDSSGTLQSSPIATKEWKDTTPPVVVPVVTPSPANGANGWWTTNVTVSFNVTDPQWLTLNKTGCDATTVSQDTTGITFTCTATNGAGLSASGSATVKVDKTAPQIVPTLNPPTPDGANGWYDSDVTVSWSRTDPISGVGSSTGCDTTTTDTNTAGTTLTCSATNGAGLSASESVTFKLDKDGPIVSGSPTTSPNAAGWYNGNVSIDWTCSDAPAGLDGPCPPDSTIGGEGTGLTAVVTVKDLAGNQTTAISSPGVNIDKTPPLTKATAPDGWNNVSVTVNFSATDVGSGVKATYFTVDGGPVQSANTVTISTDGVHSVVYWSVDRADNIEAVQSVTVMIDQTAPKITHTQVPPPIQGWNNTSVFVDFTCSDDPPPASPGIQTSGILSCGPDTNVSTEGLNQIVTGEAVDNAGNKATDPASVSIDKTDPTITASRTPATGNANGWNNTKVTVSFSCSDGLSGVAASGCPGNVEVTDGADQTVAGSVFDAAGNQARASVTGINVDTKKPVVTVPANIVAEATGPNGAAVTYTPAPSASDTGGSGVATFGCTPLSGSVFPLGVTSVSCTAIDLAGNSGGASFTVTVQDTTPPTIAAHADVTKEASSAAGAVVTYTSPTTSDLVDGAGVASCTPVSGSQFALGDTTVNCNATDTRGNKATPTTFVVHVVDTTPPVIAVAEDITEEADSAAGSIVTYTAPGTTDVVDGDGVATCLPASGSLFVLGQTTVTCNATDKAGNKATPVSFVVEVVDTTPPAASIVGTTQTDEGSSGSWTVTASDLVSTSAELTIAWDLDNDGIFTDASGPTASRNFVDNGTFTIKARVTDKAGNSTTVSLQVAVANVAPVASAVTAPVGPLALGSSATASVSFADPGSLDTHTCGFAWDDGSTTTVTAAGTGNGSCLADHTYGSAGVYSITVTVTDKDGGADSSTFQYVVVYDPGAGFVTGGGWIMSPAGAYVADPSLTGKANFGFNSKYQKGANVPTGQTEFQFKAGNLNFHSSSYEWLVVAGHKAQYKGIGTINGSGSYGFLLTVTDGQQPGGGGVDKFRIKITGTSGLVYDNKVGGSDDIDNADPQAIGGGSIVIHD